MKKIIINCNDCFAAYKFRLGLIKQLQKSFQVYVTAAFDHYTQLLKDENINVILIDSASTGTNILQDCKTIRSYKKIFREIQPDIIINYTIKPHTYAAMTAPRRTRVINVVTGIGSAFGKKNLIYKIVKCLYRFSTKKVDYYIFLNQDDYEVFRDLKIIRQPHSFIPGEGVDLSKFDPTVDFSKPITFLFSGRLIKEKGILEYLEAARIVKKKFPDTRFYVAGSFYKKHSSISKKVIDDYEKAGIIRYFGHCYDMNILLRDVHCVVLPSYREGMPISLIEGLASKKFLIACNVPGCREIVIDGYNGFLTVPESVFDLAFKMEKYIYASDKEQLHENAYQSSKQYDQNLIIPKIIGIIEGNR